MEGNPIRIPRGPGKYLQKSGNLWCVRGNGVDKNFGCYGSREQAEAVMNGKSFIQGESDMNLRSRVKLRAYGTAEGLRKAWDARGRGRKEDEHCVGPDCIDSREEHGITLMNEVPQIHSLEIEMDSTKSGNLIRFDKESLKKALQHAIEQLNSDETNPKIDYINQPHQKGTYHYVKLHFDPSAGPGGYKMYGGGK